MRLAAAAVVLAVLASPLPAQASEHPDATVDSAKLNAAPASDPITPLAGKVPGLRVARVTGGPGTAPSVLLRGTNGGRFAEPLLVIDGVVSRLSPADLSTDDVARIDILSGAAAGALYGSEGGNGVIAITTKRASPGTVQARASVGFHDLPRVLSANLHHWWQIDSTGQYVLVGGNRVVDPDRIVDNPYSVVYDYPGAFVASRLTSDAYVSGGRTVFGTTLDASAQEFRDAGVQSHLTGYARDGLRLGAERAFLGRVTLRGNAQFVHWSLGDLPGDNFFPDLMLVQPDAPLDSAYRGNAIHDRSLDDRSSKDDRFTWTLGGEYVVLPWLSLDARTSRERSTVDLTSVSSSSAFREHDRLRAGNTLFGAEFTPRSVGSFDIRGRLAFIDDAHTWSTVQGNAGAVAVSAWQRMAAQAELASVSATTRSGLALDALVRRDDIRWLATAKPRFYQRLGASYSWRTVRLHVTDGAAATLVPIGVPEAFVVCGLPCTPPPAPISFTREGELGAEVRVHRDYTVGYTYARQRTTEGLVRVPVAAIPQYVYELESVLTTSGYADEGTVGARLHLGDVEWNTDFFVSRWSARIDGLKPQPFLTGPGPNTTNTQLFRIAAGEHVGTMYGERWIRTPAQLQETIDAGRLPGTSAQYRLNEEGYYVDTAAYHTINERPLKFFRCVAGANPCTNTSSVIAIGNTTPDFNLDATTSVRWHAFMLRSTLEWAKGGDVYDYTRQWPFNELTDRAVDQSGKARTSCPIDWSDALSPNYDPHCPFRTGRKPANYYSTFYDNFNANDYFIESGTYVKIRELSLDWRLPAHWTRMLSDALRGASIGFAARNVWSSSSYPGYDPDAWAAGTPVNAYAYHVDYFTYPSYRTFVFRLQTETP